MDSGTRPVGSCCSSPAGLSREYKLVMLGAGGVGKSAMTMQFISHRFPEDHDPTIEDAYKIRIRIDDEPANLDILDTAGQAEFTAMRDQYMRAGEGFIICYSITDRRSFHEVREFKQLIYRVRRTDDTPVVLVGNKSDLKQLRQVTKEEGLA
ncbi:RIT1 isoform 5, partial [Pan troglodytes]